MIDPMFVFRQQCECELLYHCVKSGPHLIKSGSLCTLYYHVKPPTMPCHQAGSSTIHTTTSSPQHLRSFRTNVNLHTYLCRVSALSQARQASCAASIPSMSRHHGRVRPHPCCVTIASHLYMPRKTSVPRHDFSITVSVT
ncbi:hypothetical protein BDR03DRAFT_735515 [Suillus americanus]|nr:hypothetical protein BDR03DRAFT_735515 [Suillus americanus]